MAAPQLLGLVESFLHGEMAMVLGLVVVCSGCLLILIMMRWNEMRYTGMMIKNKGLPPGNMGWPVIGHTSEFLKQGPTFIKNQRARYGNVFRTHILGSPTVICSDPEINRYILMNEAKGLIPGYPKSFLEIMGKWNFGAIHGPPHKALRSVMLGLIGPASIKDQLLLKIDEFMRSYLCKWNGKVIDIHEETKELWLHSALEQIASIKPGSPLAKALKPEIMRLLEGTLSLPFNFPGTNFRRGLQARNKILSLLDELIKERRASPSSQPDILDSLLRNDDPTKPKLIDEQITDTVLTLIHSGFETVSTTMMMAVKFLLDEPKALDELRNEQFAIRNRKSPDDALDWNDYKAMTFTFGVIHETLRLATVVNGVMRKATQDVQLEGFTIPKGWRIYVYNRELNYDPFKYPEPFKFNPRRWMDQSLESHQHYMTFGGGGRLCPGKEMGIVYIAIFLHYFVTRYRWEEVGENTLRKFPRVEAPNGLHIRVCNLID